MPVGGPVPGRECGACDVCCVVFEIKELAKPAGARCTHLGNGGCSIYDRRPAACRAWLCGWRLIPGLPENWRPDLSGILIYQISREQPGYNPASFIIALSRGTEHLKDRAVLGFIHNMIKARIPLYLSVMAGKAGDRSVFLNENLAPMVRDDDPNAFIAALARAIETAGLPQI